jgi:hypothetical protein
MGMISCGSDSNNSGTDTNAQPLAPQELEVYNPMLSIQGRDETTYTISWVELRESLLDIESTGIPFVRISVSEEAFYITGLPEIQNTIEAQLQNTSGKQLKVRIDEKAKIYIEDPGYKHKGKLMRFAVIADHQREVPGSDPDTPLYEQTQALHGVCRSLGFDKSHFSEDHELLKGHLSPAEVKELQFETLRDKVAVSLEPNGKLKSLLPAAALMSDEHEGWGLEAYALVKKLSCQFSNE